MLRQNQLINRLVKQRDMLDELISKLGEANQLEGVNHLYDSTTRQIQQNLQSLRRSLFKKTNRRM